MRTTLVLAASLLLPASAVAGEEAKPSPKPEEPKTQPSVAVACSDKTLFYSSRNPGDEALPLVFRINGEVVFIDLVPPNSTSDFEVPLPGSFSGVVTGSVTLGNKDAVEIPFTAECTSPSVPPTPPVVTSPTPTTPQPEVTPPPVVKLTCQDLKDRGAGIKWLKKYNCVTRTVKPKPKPIPSCEDLDAWGAGKKWYTRLGCRYNRPPSTSIGVTG